MKNKESMLRHAIWGALLTSFLGLSSSGYAVDPCSQTSKLSGGTTVTTNGIKDIGNGFNYELWRDGSSGSLTYFGGTNNCAFKANWNNSGDFLARVGYYYGGSNSKTHSQIGEIQADYNYTKTGTGGGYSYIGIYGWTNSPQIEYYIVDDSYNGMGTPYNTSQVGSYTLDGATYKLYKGTRTNAPSITGTSTFTQVFAVRASARTCGHISVSEHFKNWEKAGIQMGGMYDCKFLCEAGGGSGSIEYTYANMYLGSAQTSDEPATPTVAQGPYKEAIEIPGTVEAENYDVGGNSFAYYDTDDTNEGGEYRQDGVDVVKLGSGYAVGYTTSDEWLEYTVNVKTAGAYNVEALAANGNGDISLELYLDDKKIATLSGSKTADWDTYTKVTGKTSTLTAGKHILKVKFGSSYNNLDYVKFYAEGGTPADTTTTLPSAPTTTTTPSNTPIASGSYFSEDGGYFGPTCGSTDAENSYKGAYYTGKYTSPFATYLGKSESDIQGKLDQLWNHYFKGDDNSKVYYDKGTEAYIYDSGNGDVRSEGMSYGMMICVQTNHHDEFDKLWAFAKNHMLHTSGQWQGNFAWQCGTDGSVKDQNCAPDGEMYFMMSLLFAANRWGNDGKYNYMEDAQFVLKNMIKGSNGSLFNEQYKVVTFQPYNCSDYSDPSYDLPAFVDLFSRWSTTNNSFWKDAAAATRNHLKVSSNSSSGLYTDYNNFDGTPKSTSFNSNSQRYMYDAMRCAMNVGMDYYLFGADAANQEAMMGRLINFFEKDGYTHARFNWDGSNAAETYTLGEAGANAVGCYALMGNSANDAKVKKNLEKAWNGTLMTGQYRYYDGLVHYLAMLHLCGSFKIWKPAPAIEKKTVEGTGSVTYLGTTYKENTTITAFENCKLYNVTINVNAGTGIDNPTADNESIVLLPNPASDHLTVKSADAVQRIEIINRMGQTVLSQEGSNIVSLSLPTGIYFVQVYTDKDKFTKKLIVR